MKKNIFVKAISFILLATFSFQNILWANPTVISENYFKTLQIPLSFKFLDPIEVLKKEILLVATGINIEQFGLRIPRKIKTEKGDIELLLDFENKFKTEDETTWVIPCDILSEPSGKLRGRYYATLDPTGIAISSRPSSEEDPAKELKDESFKEKSIEVIPNIQIKGRLAEGRAIIADSEAIEIVQLYNPQALEWDVDIEKIAHSGKKSDEYAPGSKPLKEWVSEFRREFDERGERKYVFASNSLQTNFKGPNGFLIINGELIRKKDGIRGEFQAEYEPLNGEYTVFVIDKDNRGIRKVQIDNNRLLSTEYKEATSGPALVKDGKDVSDQMRRRDTSQDVPDKEGPRKDRVIRAIPNRGDEVKWDPRKTKASFSAIGVNKKGQIVILNVIGIGKDEEKSGVLVSDLAEELIKLDVMDAILLGGSADVQQHIAGDSPLIAPSRPKSTTPEAGEEGRTLNAAIIGYVDLSKFSGVQPTKSTKPVVSKKPPKAHPAFAETASLLNFWPKTDKITLENSEVFILYWAKAGMGDATYNLKFIDALNGRSIKPYVILFGTDEEIKGAVSKFKTMAFHFPNAEYELLMENIEAGKLVFADKETGRESEQLQVEPYRKKPIVIEFLNNSVNRDGYKKKNIAAHVGLINRYNQSKQKPFLIGIHEFSDDLGLEHPGDLADFADIYILNPAVDPRQAASNSIYTGFLYDRELQKIVEELKKENEVTLKATILDNLEQKSFLSDECKKKLQNLDSKKRESITNSPWINRYTSIFANPLELEAFLTAIERRQKEGKLGNITIFSTYSDDWKKLSPEKRIEVARKLSESYPQPEYRYRYDRAEEITHPHRKAFTWLKNKGCYEFIDLQGDFDDIHVENAPITIINIPPIGRNVRLLHGLSLMTVVSGAGTFMDAIGMCAQSAGSPFLLYPAVEPQEQTFEAFLNAVGADETKEDAELYYKIQTAIPQTDAEKEALIRQVSEMIYRTMFDEKTRQRYMRDIQRAANYVVSKTGNAERLNGLNVITDLIGEIDRKINDNTYFRNWVNWLKDLLKTLTNILRSKNPHRLKRPNELNKLFALLTHEPFHAISRSNAFAYAMQVLFIAATSTILLFVSSIFKFNLTTLSTLSGIAQLPITYGDTGVFSSELGTNSLVLFAGLMLGGVMMGALNINLRSIVSVGLKVPEGKEKLVLSDRWWISLWPARIKRIPLPRRQKVLIIQTEYAKAWPSSANLLSKLKQAGCSIFELTVTQDEQRIWEQMLQLKPDIVLLPHPEAISPLSIKVRAKTQEAMRALSREKPVTAVSYSTLDMAEPYNLYIYYDDSYRQKKEKAMAAHVSQMSRVAFDKATIASNRTNAIEGRLLISPNVSGDYAERFILAKITQGRLVESDTATKYVYSQTTPEGVPAFKIPSDGTVLFVAPHPDDPEIAAAVLLRHCVENKNYVINLVYNSGYRAQIPQIDNDRKLTAEQKKKAKIALRYEEIQEAAQVLGINEYRYLCLPFYDLVGLDGENIITDREREEVYELFSTYYQHHLESKRKGEFVVALPQANDAHLNHRASYRISIEALERLSREKEADIAVIFYVAPWAGQANLYNYFGHKAELKNKKLIKQKASVIGEISEKLGYDVAKELGYDPEKYCTQYEAHSYALRANAITGGELVGGFAKTPPKLATLGGEFAERFLVERVKGSQVFSSPKDFDSLKQMLGGVVLYGADGIRSEKVNKCSLPINSHILVLEKEPYQHIPYSGNLISSLRDIRLNNKVQTLTLGEDIEELKRTLKGFEPSLVIAPLGFQDIEGSLKNYAQTTYGGLNVFYYDPIRKDSELNYFHFFTEKESSKILFALSSHITQCRRTEYIEVTRYLSRYAASLARYLGTGASPNEVAANPFIAAQIQDGQLHYIKGKYQLDLEALGKTTYFISPHPDDIEIAAGGLVLHLLEQGVSMRNIVMNVDKWGVIPTFWEKAKLFLRFGLKGNEKRGRLRQPEVLLSASRLQEGLSGTIGVDILNLKISEQNPGAADDDIDNPAFAQDLKKAREYIERVYESHSKDKEEKKLLFIVPFIEDSHPHHRIANKVILKLLKELSLTKGIEIDILFYLAPWAGGFDTFFHSPLNIGPPPNVTEDLNQRLSVGKLFKRGLAYLVGELAGGFGSKSPAIEELGGKYAERFIRKFYPPTDGHLAFNEPPDFSSFDSRIQEVDLEESTIEANKAKKAEIVKVSLEGPIAEDVPASMLQMHPNVTVVLDSDAAAQLQVETTKKPNLDSPREKRLIQPQPFLRNPANPGELVKNKREAIISALLDGKKVGLFFSRNLVGFEEQQSMLVDQLKRWKEKMRERHPRLAKVMDNLLIDDFSSRVELVKKLGEYQIELKDAENNIMLTFAPEVEQQELQGLGEAVRGVYIKENTLSPDRHYYPLIEIVAISIAKAHMNYTINEIYEIFESLGFGRNELEEKTNIKYIDDTSPQAFLIFTLIPKAQRYDPQEKFDRYARLLQFLQSA